MDNIEIYISAIKSVLESHGVDYDELDETFNVLDELFFQLSEARDEERIAEERHEDDDAPSVVSVDNPAVW